MKPYSTACADNEAAWSRILAHEVNGKLSSVDCAFPANVGTQQTGLGRDPYETFMSRRLVSMGSYHLLRFVLVIKGEDGALVYDSSICTKCINSTPFVKGLLEGSRLLIIIGDITLVIYEDVLVKFLS